MVRRTKSVLLLSVSSPTRSMLEPAAGFSPKAAVSTKALVAVPQATLSTISPVSAGPFLKATPLLLAMVAAVLASGVTAGTQPLLAHK